MPSARTGYLCLAAILISLEAACQNESLLEADPKASLAVKKLLGIDENYYVTVPPDPTDEEMEGIWATLRGLTKGDS